MIATSKYYFIYFALLSSFILCFIQTSKDNQVKLRILFICSLAVFLYFNFNINIKTASHFEIKPFHIWHLNANEHHTLWSPFSIGFPIIFIILISKFRFHILDFIYPSKLRRRKKYITSHFNPKFSNGTFPNFYIWR